MSGGNPVKKCIRSPLWSELPQLRALWLDGFPEDTERDVDSFLRRWFRPERCLAVCRGDRLESAAHLFRAQLLQNGQAAGEFLYLYGVVTARDCRQQGNVHSLTDGALTLAASQGLSGIFLVPDVGKEEIYRKCGFSDMGGLCFREVAVSGAHSPEEWRPCGYETFRVLRDRYLSSLPAAFRWTDASDRFFYEDALQRGRVLVCGDRYAVLLEHGDGWTIQEANFPLTDAAVCRLCGALGIRGNVMAAFPAPEPAPPELRRECYGQVRLCPGPLSGKQLETGYVNLIGD